MDFDQPFTNENKIDQASLAKINSKYNLYSLN